MCLEVGCDLGDFYLPLGVPVILVPMRLKRPGDLRRGIDTLNAAAREVEQIELDIPTLEGARRSWLRWWESADGRLRDVFADDDLITDLYRTQAAVRAVESSTHDLTSPYEGPAKELMRRECDVWKERLHDAARELEQLEAFVNRPGRVAVLDTSAFIEGGDFWEQDWPTITRADDDSASGLGPLPIRVLSRLSSSRRWTIISGTQTSGWRPQPARPSATCGGYLGSHQVLVA
jgi:hypothetical protein